MPDYSTGKIYKIINPQNEVVYIGSTVDKLCRRFAKHKHRGNGNKIVLLELCPCNSREELCMREQEHIELHENLLNDRRAFNSEEYYKKHYKEYHKEYNEKWRINNKEKVKEHEKKWRENNIEKMKEYYKVYYEENKNEISEKTKKWNDNNKEKVKEYNKKYRQNNIDKLNENQKIKILCVCGCQIRKSNITTHKKSQKHIKLMNTIKEQYK